MTVEMVIKRLYFASAKKRGNCTFRFEKLYVSFSRLYNDPNEHIAETMTLHDGSASME